MPNTHQIPDILHELQALSGDLLPAVILSTTWPTVPAPPSLTFAAFATRGYVKDGTTLIYVEQPAHTVSMGSSPGTYWLALHRDTTTPVVGWARQPGTHYLLFGGPDPGNPVGGLTFASVTVAGGAITAVTPLPVVMGNPPAWREHIGLGLTASVQFGRLGLGTAAPSGGTLLQVQGDTLLTGMLDVQSNANFQAALAAQGNVTTAANVGIRKSGGTFTDNLEVFGTTLLSGNTRVTTTLTVDGPLVFGAAATTRTNLGLGSLATQNANAVSITGGSATFTGVLTAQAGTNLAANAYTAANFGILKSYGSAFTYNLEVLGTAAKNGGGPFDTLASSRRLKRHIRPLVGALATLLQLRGRQWEWREECAVLEAEMPGTQTGLVLEEVAAVLPAWVTWGPEGPVGYGEKGFTALVVEALREVVTRLASLETARAAGGATSA